MGKADDEVMRLLGPKGHLATVGQHSGMSNKAIAAAYGIRPNRCAPPPSPPTVSDPGASSCLSTALLCCARSVVLQSYGVELPQEVEDGLIKKHVST